jgi:hypothetical protein
LAVQPGGDDLLANQQAEEVIQGVQPVQPWRRR